MEFFNHTLQEEFLNYNKQTMAYNPRRFNKKLIEYLLWYNTKRPHWSLNLKSPLQFSMEEDLSARIEKSRKEIKIGKGKILRSLRDLR